MYSVMIKNKKKKVLFTTKWLTYTALMTALVVATGYIPGIPVLTGKIYWCDFAIYTAAYLLDPLAAFIVGGIGTTFFDLFGINGTAYNAIPSLVIHGIQGLLASATFILLRKYFNKTDSNKREGVIAVISSILPALWVIFGYFVKRITWETLLPETAVLKMPANVLQEVIGITVAIVICYVCRFKKQLKGAHLLPDFKAEILDKSEQVEAASYEKTEPQSVNENIEN